MHLSVPSESHGSSLFGARSVMPSFGRNMEALLIILAAAAAVISALTYPARPKCTVAVSVITTTIGAGALALLMFGPKDYMLRIPSSMTTILHPWILGGFGTFLIILGIGGIVGFFARLLMGRKTFR
jgi:hypothetical protein